VAALRAYLEEKGVKASEVGNRRRRRPIVRTTDADGHAVGFVQYQPDRS